MNRRTIAPAIALVAVLAAACKPAGQNAAERATPDGRGGAQLPMSRGVSFVLAPGDGSVATLVKDALLRARAQKRTLVVYVGAAWCEPCRLFHEAALRGDLDASLPALTFLEFDIDRDHDRLVSAGYVSKFIPLFALPTSSGLASGQQVEGGVKGDGAVAFILPRLQALLAR